MSVQTGKKSEDRGEFETTQNGEHDGGSGGGEKSLSIARAGNGKCRKRQNLELLDLTVLMGIGHGVNPKLKFARDLSTTIHRTHGVSTVRGFTTTRRPRSVPKAE